MREKKIIFLVLFFLNQFCAIAQGFGDATIKCTYKLTYVKDPSDIGNKTEDFMVLEVGRSSSVFYSYNTFRVDSAIQDDIKKGISPTQMAMGRAKYGRKGVLYKIYKNYASKKTTVSELVVSDYYLYEEPLHAQQWSVKPDKSVVLGYEVQKAICSFGGRDFVAWFAPEIAVNNGPWKFGGLPGLIVKIEDSKKHYRFELTGFEKLAKPSPIQLDQNKYIKLSKADFLKIQKRATTNFHDFVKNQMGIEMTPLNNAAKESANRVRPYNPIEWN